MINFFILFFNLLNASLHTIFKPFCFVVAPKVLCSTHNLLSEMHSENVVFY